MKPLIRTLTPEVRIVSAKDFTCEYVASDESVDSYREVIRAAGWRFNNFKKNAPFVDSHDYSTIERLLGSVEDFKVAGGQLVERVRWAANESKLAMLGWKMTESGHLRAVSVGFMPVRTVTKFGDGRAAFLQAVAELKLSEADAAKVEAIYLEQEQIELSACIIGANPNALARAHTEGAITDADLSANGFDDDDMDFLHASAEVFDLASDRQKAVLTRALARIPFRKTTAATAATDSTQRAAESEANARRERETWLAEFQRKIKSLT